LNKVTYLEAINQGLEIILKNNKNSFLIGEDIGKHGGAFGVTRGLFEKLGKDKVIDMPISENSFVGMAIGASLVGYRVIIEIMFIDWITLAMDQIINIAAKLYYISGGQYNVPIVIRVPQGGGGRKGTSANHSQSFESLLMNIPGLKVVFPSNPHDAKGLLMSSFKDENPVIFIEHKNLYSEKGNIPDEEIYYVPIGKGNLKKEGKDITVISAGRYVNVLMDIADKVENIDMEIIDLVSLKPIDEEIIINSIKKTGRVLVVQEAPLICGFAAEIISLINEKAFDYLDTAPKRVCGKDVPVPYCTSQEINVFPSENEIIEAIYDLCK
jgi:acetoin:2,6-dichlorophenolindophenol oxidoreductase subunit beta